VYDPCAGWGERLLACGINDIKYFGCDINDELANGHNQLIEKYNLKNIQVEYCDSKNFSAAHLSHDTVFTCPPYHNREIYTNHGSENLVYDEFLSWWKSVCENSISPNTKYFMYQIDKRHRNDMNQILINLGFTFVEEIIVGKNNIRHENRANGATIKFNYEAIQIFKI
jgi:tRNA G10  N-methylase Trm11